MKDIVKFPLTLFIITAIVAACLSGLYIVTKAPIAKAAEAKKASSLYEIFGKNIEMKTLKKEISLDEGKTKFELEYFEVKSGDQVYYATIGKSDKCYTSGVPIEIMVGVSPDFKIVKIAVVRSAETPGLGENIKNTEKKSIIDILTGKKDTDPDRDKRQWLRQFNDREYANLKVDKDGGDIQSIAGATITSRAVILAVDDAVKKLTEALKKEAETPKETVEPVE